MRRASAQQHLEKGVIKKREWRQIEMDFSMSQRKTGQGEEMEEQALHVSLLQTSLDIWK